MSFSDTSETDGGPSLLLILEVMTIRSDQFRELESIQLVIPYHAYQAAYQVLERGIYIFLWYFSVVTGTHYGTKTPPDQQPSFTKLCAGGMTRLGAIYSSMFSSKISRVRCLVWSGA